MAGGLSSGRSCGGQELRSGPKRATREHITPSETEQNSGSHCDSEEPTCVSPIKSAFKRGRHRSGHLVSAKGEHMSDQRGRKGF